MSDQTEYVKAYLAWQEEPRDTSPEGYAQHCRRVEADLMITHLLEILDDALGAIERDSGVPSTLKYVGDTLEHAKRNILEGGDFE